MAATALRLCAAALRRGSLIQVRGRWAVVGRSRTRLFDARTVNRLVEAGIAERKGNVAMRRKVNVTDHALVRWLERCRGFPIERMRDELAELVHHGAEAGAVSIKVEGMEFLLDRWVLKSVVPIKSKMR